MSKILSQEEVDALLKGVQSGEIEVEAKTEETGDVKPYDFTAQERIIRGRMPGLEIANDKFTRLFRNSISSVLMKFVDVNVHGVEMMMFNEFMKTLPLPSSINIFKMAPLKGYALFIMEAPMVFAFIEYFFGSNKAQYVKTEGRYFTPIEQRVIRKIVGLALENLASAWEGLVPIRPEYVGLEMNPQFVTIVTPTEGVIKIELGVEVEDFQGKMFFCIPYSMVEPIKEKLFSGIKGDKHETDHRWVSRLKEALKNSFVNIVVEIGKAELTVGELMDLKVGNVITLGKSISDELDVKVEGILKFKGTPGLSRGNQAVKITKLL
jgi:flagellar motor switch protein FliM